MHPTWGWLVGVCWGEVWDKGEVGMGRGSFDGFSSGEGLTTYMLIIIVLDFSVGRFWDFEFGACLSLSPFILSPLVCLK
jgi:hypothetical protein